MGTRKKGSELVFNLQWRNMPDNGGDRSNVVGMYDSPATTLNFETFKSYLLKNSGVLVNDVKVTYLTDNGAEWVIDSPEWFEIALCAFRLKARLGEVIFLKLDKISNHMMRKHSNDVETQFDNDSAGNSAPPEWFLMYMKQFKRDLVEEVTYAVSANMSAAATKETPVAVAAPPPVVVGPPKKAKSEPSKRSRKHMLLGETPIDKELLKTLKFDRKLEIKLDKLDAKTKKIKEKKQALISKLEQTEEPKNSQNIPPDFEGAPWMDASLVNQNPVIPHMLGGEIYLHSWEVINSGKMPWTTKTELRLTWGPAEMKPDNYVIRCPLLPPGEKGVIRVRFQVPQLPGRYESYWNFYEGSMRFGHWLSCCVVVDGPVCYQTEKVFSKKPKIEQTPAVPEEELKEKNETFVMVVQENSAADSEVEGAVGGNSVIDLSKRIQDIKIVGKSEVDSDSDWESLWSFKKEKNLEENNMDGAGTNKYGINEKDLIVDLSTSKENNIPSVETKKEKVVEKEEVSNDDNNNNGVNKASSEESICGIASEASSDISSGYDVISAPICEDKEDSSGYVYVTIDGNKLPVPKHILRPDFLANAEEAPGPVKTEDEKTTTTQEVNPAEATAIKLESELQKLEQDLQETISHCSAAGTCFSDVNAPATSENSRLFIFPQNNPGYEVVAPPYKAGSTTKAEPTWSHSQYTFGDLQNACNMRYDPYGPLDQSRPTSSTQQATLNQTFPNVPNFQQSNPRRCSLPPPHKPKATPTAPPLNRTSPPEQVSSPPQVHILPENLVNGAVNVASSAINTARSVINMIVPKTEPGKWVNGHYVMENVESARAKNLCILADMGFWDQDLNATLLARYNDDISRVVSELLQQ